MQHGEMSEFVAMMNGAWPAFATTEEVILGWRSTLVDKDGPTAIKALDWLITREDKRPTPARFIECYQMLDRQARERAERMLPPGADQPAESREESWELGKEARARIRETLERSTGPLFGDGIDGIIGGDDGEAEEGREEGGAGR